MIPVYVDLDRTLIKRSTSTLELRNYVLRNGLKGVISAILKNRLFTKLKLKSWVSEQPTEIDYSNQFKPEVISLILDFRLNGSPIILATASTRISTERVMAQCPIEFDEWITSSRSKNIKGIKKLSEIQKSLKLYGSNSFVYVGDSFHDLKIMRSSSQSFFVGKKMVYFLGRYLFQITEFKNINSLTQTDRGA